jgi:SSS family solute:Na+ symporter
MAYLTILVLYAGLMVALGVYMTRSVRKAADFFVAGRSLGPGLLFATLLAANIGGGSTVGATGLDTVACCLVVGWLSGIRVDCPAGRG